MLRFLVKSKIQRPRITDKNLYYEGSITIDEDLLQKADIVENEMVQIVNVNTGARFETYVMKGERNSGAIVLNGGAARLGEIGDEIIIISYAAVETISARSFEPKKVFVDKDNHIINDRNNSRSG
ncbi:MAG: aspartate 1-decarboxylase [Candidatus Latescibacteria bacterium]|nr:aspartate 1-decarboxylase [Candidatus Latescibacterota bacterium]